MAKWKLARQIFREEEYMFSEGDKITIGRGLDNTITLSSLMISRHHCVIEVKRDNILIKDLKSSNGTYIEKTKIPENQPFVVKDSDVIGFGWTSGASLIDINNEDKYIFKLVKESCDVSLRNRITFQSEPDDIDFCDDIKTEDAKLNKIKLSPQIPKEEIPEKINLKRRQEDKTHIKKVEIKQKTTEFHQNTFKDVINLLSDSDTEANKNQQEPIVKKFKLEALQEEPLIKEIKQECVKVENDDILEYEPFKVKQEYLGYYDDVIELVDSDSDSESEKWKQRLSQNSPGKPFIKMKRDSNVLVKQDDTSYSQLDDDGIDIILNANQELFEDDDIIDDLITIPVQPPPVDTNHQTVESDTDYGEYLQDANPGVYKEPDKTDLSVRDTVDALSTSSISKVTEIASPSIRSPNDVLKGAQMIDPLVHSPGRKSNCVPEIKNKSTLPKHSKGKRHSTSRRHISNSQKEERKKKLKEIAIKEKDEIEANRELCANVNKPTVNVKVTSTCKSSSNRGAFLTEVAQAVVKPLITKTSPQKLVNDKKSPENLDETKKTDNHVTDCENTERLVKNSRNEHKRSKHRRKKVGKHERSNSVEGRPREPVEPSLTEQRVPVKSLTPLTDSSKSLSGKPVSKVEPLPPKKLAKKVRFTNAPPQVRVFQIEPGNRMKKTSLVKTTLVDIRQTPIFSLQKLSLMKILRWNPHWLEEQINNNDPPPILSHNSTPMTMIHFFDSHSQYVKLVGDLLLMEIWECLSQAYMKIRGQFDTLQMVIQSLPPVPTQDRYFDLFNISVNVSLPKTQKNQKSDPKVLPRVGEILYVTFGPEKSCRFFFVHNVRRCPSDAQLVYSITLQTTYTEKMCTLRVGDTVAGARLAYINNELVLFEAMEHVASSPLGDLILKPEPRHFPPPDPLLVPNIKSQWMLTLNESQQAAVVASVASALGDRPAVQMVQGPPGTGKSSVICAIVMTYFYDLSGKKYHNRGKILICATSNPAVDELVLRLLAIRQKMPKPERFRMVRVGRAEAMHPRAQDVSSQQLAQRDAARAHPPPHAHPPPPGLAEEISHLQAKINMNLAAARDAKDSAQVAYYESRVAYFQNRLALVNSASGRGGGGGEEQLRPEALAAAERRIVEGADIVLTTLASAHNYKMRGLKRRIALCIVDEAGQAIEPEALVPLTLAVTHLTLIGDPRQLPGYICSQRAKKLGLGESLFTRLSSCAEQWVRGEGAGAPVVLLDQQYRMHPAIADYPNRAFYGGRVRDHGPAALDLPVPPYAIVCIASGDRGQGAAGGNETEAWGAARVASALAGGLRARGLSLALITPYHAHKDLLRRNLRLLMDPAAPPVEVNTVDSFQGQERDVVVVSLARSHGAGFLTDAGRMNVMLTRAKRALLICLNPNALLKNHQWRTLVEDAQKRNVYRVLPNKFCQPSTGGEIVTDDILKYIYK